MTVLTQVCIYCSIKIVKFLGQKWQMFVAWKLEGYNLVFTSYAVRRKNVLGLTLKPFRKRSLSIRYHSRFFDSLAHPNLNATFVTDQKWPLSCLCISYQILAKEIRKQLNGHFWSVAKVARRFGYAKQSKNLERYLNYLGNFLHFIVCIRTV